MPQKPPLISPEIRAKLETARVARLATLGPERKPHAVPICFVYDGSAFYSAIDRKPKRAAASQLSRVKNIQETPQVALLVDHYEEDWTRLWYVLVRGEAELVCSPATPLSCALLLCALPHGAKSRAAAARSPLGHRHHSLQFVQKRQPAVERLPSGSECRIKKDFLGPHFGAAPDIFADLFERAGKYWPFLI